MSQKTARKSFVTDEKEKGQTDSPVKDMKKKVAANAEKEKHAAEKSVDKPDRPDKPIDKAEKPADKATDKTDKATEKTDKPTDKATDKATDKKIDKNEKKPDAAAEKKEENKEEKAGKSDAKPESKPPKPKQNGNARVNGASNGDHNGTVSPAGDEEEDDGDDEMFPELTYDDTSDPEFEPDMPHGRSHTRRSQAKVTRTPETPRPASERAPEGTDDSKDSKVLKLKEDIPSTDRKLRSADSPKPEGKKQENKEKSQESENKQQESANKEQESANKSQESANKPQESPKPKESGKKEESPKKPAKEKQREEKENGDGKIEIDIVVEIEDEDEPRKTDTNFSKSRVKVSPYRRSMRADQTASSTMANYTGNNTTMEMDITESSFVSTEASLDDSSYLSGLRNIRGRRSYKPLKEMTLRQIDRSRAGASGNNITMEIITESSFVSTEASLDDSSYLGGLRNIRGRRSYKPLKEMTLRQIDRSRAGASAIEHPTRPTGTVVGRKRKPDADYSIEVATEAGELSTQKRMRLLDRLATTFRRTASTPLPARRNAEIVGINTDLPLTAPVASTDTFDPETLKTAPAPAPAAVPISPVETDKDNKRCVIM